VARLSPELLKDQIWSAYRESNFTGVLMERHIQGKEFSVESFIEQGHIHNLAITAKEHYPENECIDRRNLYLGDVAPATEAALFAANNAVIQALGLQQGPTHGEYMVTENGRVYLMEIAARGGGGNISEKLVPYLTGFSPTEGILNFAVGRANAMNYRSYRERFAVMRFVNLDYGWYRPIKLPPPQADWFLHFDLNLDREFESRPVRDSRDRLGYFVVKGNTPAEALRREEIEMGVIREAARGEKL
jgi:carbamoyl-phosphate synthase large subunit